MEDRLKNKTLASEADKADEALRASESRYRRLFETAKDGILILDGSSGLITDVNPFLVSLLDYPREEFIGKALWDIGPFRDIAASKAAFQELQDKEYIRYDDLPLQTRSGRRINVEFVSNVYGVNGARVIQCNIRDITARKQGEEALLESQQYLTAIIASAMDSIITVDEQQRIVLFNTAAEKMFRCPAAEALGQPLERFIPTRFRVAHSEHVRQFAECGLTSRGIGHLDSLWALRADGEEFQMEASISQVQSRGRKLLTVILRDVTERTRAEAALQESERQFRTLGDSIPQLAWIANADGWIFWYNQRWYQYTGTTLDQMQGWGWQSVHDPAELPKVLQQWQRSIASGEPFDMVFPLRGADAVFRPFLTRVMPVKNAQGQVVHWFGTNTDISEQTRTEKALRQSEARLNEAQRIAHIGSWHYLPNGQVTWSDEVYELYKLPRHVPVTYEAIVSVMHPEDRDRSRGLFQKRLESDAHEFQNESRIVWPDGQIRNLFVLGKIHRDLEGRVIDVAGTVQDVTERKQAEESLRRSEENHRLLFEQTPDGVFVSDARGRYLDVNPAGVHLIGYAPDELRGLTIADVVAPEEVERIAPEVARLAGGGVVATKWRFKRKDGSIFDGAILARQLSDGRLLAILTDVTERIRAEAALREYARVVECLEEMILVVDRQYRYVIANRAYLNYRGMSADQVIGRFVHEVVGEDIFATDIKEKMDACFLGEVVQYQLRRNIPNRGRRDLWVSYFPIDGPAGVDRIACVLQDITERKLADEALRKSEDRFRQAFRCSPLASTISTEAEGRYLDVNDAFLKMVKQERRDVIGRTAFDIGFWVEPSQRKEVLRQLGEGGPVAGFRTQCKTSAGDIRELEVSAEMIDIAGQRCVLAISRDITETRRLEAQFLQAQKMEAVGRLAGGVAHDFNNILGVIIGYSDLSLDLVRHQGPVNKHLQQIKKASQRAVLLIRQLLAFSRLQVAFPRILNPNDVVHNVIDMLERMVGEDVEVSFRPTSPIGSIKVDPGQIEQILMNLAVNARDAMPGGGKIVIETGNAELDEHYVFQHPGSQTGPHVVLAFSDTGCGMDENVKSKIFEPFFTTKAVGQGTGLGLSTVYGIVKQNGGCVFVYSEPGEGTTFRIYFPKVLETAEELLPSQEETGFPGGSETILLVEDDESLRDLTANMLQDAGYRVVKASDVETALGLLQAPAQQVDLLLTDVIMPGKSGVDLLALARIARPHLRSLFMSGYAADLITQRGGLTLETPFLEKPFTRSSLLTKVHSILHGESEE